MESLKVAIISESAGNWPVYAGLEKGFFKEESLDVKVTITRSSVKQMDDLKAGGVYDIGHQAADHIIRAVEEGSDLFAFMGLTTPNHSLIVRPDIKSYEDLRGKTIGVDGPNTGFALLLKGLLEQNGLILDKDYKFRKVGGTGERYQAILNGEVAGAFLDGPIDILAESKGLNRLGSNLDYLVEYQGTVAAAKRSWAAAHKDKLLAYIRSYVRASGWLHDLNNKGEAVEILRRYLDIDSSIAGLTHERYLSMKTFNPDAAMNLRGMEEAIKVMVHTGQLKTVAPVEKYYDDSFYKAAEEVLG